MVIARGWREEGSYLLMGSEFWFSKKKSSEQRWWWWLHTNVNDLNTLKCNLKMAKMVNVMFCVFYHNKKYPSDNWKKKLWW